MTAYVVDTSVVIAFLITEPYTDYARSLFNSLVVDDEIYIPEFCRLECTNVLWRHVRFNQMPPDKAEQLVSDLLELPLILADVSGLLIDALRIGLAHQLAVYDSLYLALAKSLNLPLITLDTKQELAASKSGVTLKPITDFPPPSTDNA